ncbi:hypothetical protein Lal_00024176 [Lupinus albus]|nr:hypothetical protein Lal_00024176 [Lupinus albus]
MIANIGIRCLRFCHSINDFYRLGQYNHPSRRQSHFTPIFHFPTNCYTGIVPLVQVHNNRLNQKQEKKVRNDQPRKREGGGKLVKQNEGNGVWWGGVNINSPLNGTLTSHETLHQFPPLDETFQNPPLDIVQNCTTLPSNPVLSYGPTRYQLGPLDKLMLPTHTKTGTVKD